MSIEYRDSQDSAERELDISVSPTHAAEAWTVQVTKIENPYIPGQNPGIHT